MAAMAGALFATKTCIGTDVLNPEYDNLDKARAIARDAKSYLKRNTSLWRTLFRYGFGTITPAIHCDVCVCHVQQVGEEGTVRIDGSLTFDHYAVHAAKKVIVTAEQVVPEEYLRRDLIANQIPCTSVDMIVEVPWGGHPGQVYNFMIWIFHS